MNGQLPALHPSRDGLRELIKLINQIRNNVPARTTSVIDIGVVSLLSTSVTEIVPANSSGWVTTAVHLFPVTITGAQATAPIVRLGSNATHDNVAPLFNLGIGLVVDTQVSITLATTTLQSNPVSFEVQTAGTGPTVLTADVFILGYFA